MVSHPAKGAIALLHRSRGLPAGGKAILHGNHHAAYVLYIALTKGLLPVHAAEETAAAMEEDDPLVADVTTRSQEAYRNYLQGVDYIWKMMQDEAKACFRRAIEIDSTFLMAHLRLLGTPGDADYDERWSIILRNMVDGR